MILQEIRVLSVEEGMKAGPIKQQVSSTEERKNSGVGP